MMLRTRTYSRILTNLLTVPVLSCCALAGAFTPGSLLLADFVAAEPSAVTTQADAKVTSVAVAAAPNSLDDSRAALFSANLTGPQAGWAGVSLPVPSDSASTAAAVLVGADNIELDLRGEGGTHGVFITLNEKDGSRWNANVRVTSNWKRHRVPLHQFTWFAGPTERKSGHLAVQNVKSVDLWTGNTFQGPNGFGFDNVRLLDEVPKAILRLEPPAAPLPVQQDTKVVIETVETTGGPVVPFSGHFWVHVPDRNKVLIPQMVPVEEGRGEIPVFAREYGPFELSVYEPHSRAELTTKVLVATEGSRITLGIKGIDDDPVVFNNHRLATYLHMKGFGSTTPLSAHVRITDHTGRVVMARNESIADLQAGKSSLRIPGVGPFQIDVTALAEEMSALPRAQDIPSMRFESALRTGKIEQYIDLPEGVTTTTAAGTIISLADLPSTATVLGRDRLMVWSLTRSPVENAGLYRSPFGICSGALFHRPEMEIVSAGRERLEWHRRLGSFWGRDDLWWHEIEPSPGNFYLRKAAKVHDLYVQYKIKLVGILGYGAAWAKEGAAPDSPEEREKFRNYVRQLIKQFSKGLWAVQVWNEPNTGFWKPQPDMDAYRELVKVTWEELRGGETTVPERIVSGATAGYDPVFLEHLMKDGYAKYLDVVSIQPYPQALDRSPEENNLPEILQAFRALRSKYRGGEEAWITEIGWPTMPGGVDEFDQANYLLRSYVIALANGISKVFWFNLADWEARPWVGEFGAHTGLLDSTYRPKPSFSAYNLMAHMLAELQFVKKSQQGRAVIYSFDILEQTQKFAGGKVHVAWTLDRDAVEEVDLPIVAGGPVYTFDYLGAEREPELISKAQGMPSPESSEANPEVFAPRAAAAETSATVSAPMYPVPPSPDDAPTTHTYRFRITHEPLYIWDAGVPSRRRK